LCIIVEKLQWVLPRCIAFFKKKDEKLGTGFEMQTFAAIHM
jgi:hypothetical protein